MTFSDISARAAKIKFSSSDAFQKAIKARVERYFRITGRRPFDNVSLYVKAAILFVWLAASYILLVFLATSWWQAIPLTVSLGVVMAAIGFCVQHDGGHRAFSSSRVVNRCAAMSLDLLGGSSFIWNHKHNTIHHTYSNIAEHDDDINVGCLGRLAPSQRRFWFHRFQHLYLWLLYGFLPMKWQFWDDYRDLVRGRIGNHRFARPKGLDLAVLIGGKTLFVTLALIVPMFFHPIWIVLVFYAVAFWVNGLIISVVFQLAHVVEKAEFPLPDEGTGRIETPWAEHQVRTTVNFARNNPVLTWLLGGLNYQVEHHLFPRISHAHYPRISRLIERACRRHGLQYNAHTGLFEAVASHFRWLRRMGQPV